MKTKISGSDGTPPVVRTVTQVLVISHHDAVRRELVMYLCRSPTLAVSGDIFSREAIVKTRPDILVLDLGQLTIADLLQAIQAARSVDARLIALASMYDPAAERAVTDAGGLYRLKSVGANWLADLAGIESIARHNAIPRLGKHPSGPRGHDVGAGPQPA